jgi:hypothetical protein
MHLVVTDEEYNILSCCTDTYRLFATVYLINKNLLDFVQILSPTEMVSETEKLNYTVEKTPTIFIFRIHKSILTSQNYEHGLILVTDQFGIITQVHSTQQSFLGINLEDYLYQPVFGFCDNQNLIDLLRVLKDGLLRTRICVRWKTNEMKNSGSQDTLYDQYSGSIEEDARTEITQSETIPEEQLNRECSMRVVKRRQLTTSYPEEDARTQSENIPEEQSNGECNMKVVKRRQSITSYPPPSKPVETNIYELIELTAINRNNHHILMLKRLKESRLFKFKYLLIAWQFNLDYLKVG